MPILIQIARLRLRKWSKDGPVTSRVCSDRMNGCSDIFTIMASDGRGSETESLNDFDEFLASSIDPDISDNEEQVAGQEKADRSGLDLTAQSLPAIFVRYRRSLF